MEKYLFTFMKLCFIFKSDLSKKISALYKGLVGGFSVFLYIETNAPWNLWLLLPLSVCFSELALKRTGLCMFRKPLLLF